MSFTEIHKSFETVFASTPWFGAGVLEKLQNYPDEVANQVYGPHDHSIGKYLRHMLVWRNYAIRKLAGDPDYKIALGSAEDFPPGEEGLSELLEQLKTNQVALLAAIAAQDADRYHQPLDAKSAYTVAELLHGVLHHDIYHLGQIGLLLRLMEPA